MQKPNTLIIPGLLLKESRKAAPSEELYDSDLECNHCGGNLPLSVVVKASGVRRGTKVPLFSHGALTTAAPRRRSLVRPFVVPWEGGGGKSDSLCWMPHESATDRDARTTTTFVL